MIILEGPDAVGKTTAAQVLCELITAQDVKSGRQSELFAPMNLYSHMTRPPDDFDHLKEFCAGVRYGVQDRYHLGSLTYGAMLNRSPPISAKHMELVQRYLRWRGCIVVNMVASKEWLRSQLLNDPKEEMYSIPDILLVNDAHRALSTCSNNGVPYVDITYNVDAGWPSQKTLESWIAQWRDRGGW